MSLFNQKSSFVPSDIAIVHGQTSVTYAQLTQQVSELAEWLTQQKVTSVCLNMPNCYHWIVVDLACQQAKIICTPVPQFFSMTQIRHLVNETQPDLILGEAVEENVKVNIVPKLLITAFFTVSTFSIETPINTHKITFTSGSTGTPKGVCLSNENQLKVATSLVNEIAIDKPKHLVLLPLATLLENIAGVYAPIMAGGQVVIPSDSEKGFTGSRLSSLPALLECISTHSPHTMILVPELLQALIAACKSGWRPPNSLKFIAVGGAKVDAKLIFQARQSGLPVYQGYGLSECASVVSICTQQHNESGSVGKVLEHLKVEIVNGELVVSGNCFLGYLGQVDTWYPSKVYTGDLVTIKNQHLFIQGRKKHLIINSFGRNISPEWVESKITASGLFAQNIVLGDAKPHLCALLVLIDPNTSKNTVEDAIFTINEELPDYAKIMTYLVLENAFNFKDGLATENGKLKRSAIEQFYAPQINQQYSPPCLATV